MQVDEHIGQGVVVSDGRAIPEFGAFNAEGHRLTVEALGRGTLLVDRLIRFTLAVHLVTQARARTGGQRRHTATQVPLRVVNRADLPGDSGIEQGADVAAAFVRDEGGLTLEAIPGGHRQTRFAQRRAVGTERTWTMVPALDERDGGKAAGLGEVVVNREGVKGGIQRAEARSPPQALLDLCHEWRKVTDIGLVKGLREFGQHEFTPVGHLGGDDA